MIVIYVSMSMSSLYGSSRNITVKELLNHKSVHIWGPPENRRPPQDTTDHRRTFIQSPQDGRLVSEMTADHRRTPQTTTDHRRTFIQSPQDSRPASEMTAVHLRTLPWCYLNEHCGSEADKKVKRVTLNSIIVCIKCIGCL